MPESLQVLTVPVARLACVEQLLSLVRPTVGSWWQLVLVGVVLVVGAEVAAAVATFAVTMVIAIVSVLVHVHVSGVLTFSCHVVVLILWRWVAAWWWWTRGLWCSVWWQTRRGCVISAEGVGERNEDGVQE